MKIYTFLFIISMTALVNAEIFTVSKKKAEPKITAHDCAQLIMQEMIDNSLLLQYTGSIQSVSLSWAQDWLENEKKSFLKKASSQDLNRLYQAKEKIATVREHYLELLKEHDQLLKELNSKAQAK